MKSTTKSSYRIPGMLLKKDMSWDNNRPIPIEPTRWGRIHVANPNIINKHPLLERYLNKNKYTGTYLKPAVVNRLIKDRKIELNKGDYKIIEISKVITREGDRVGGSLIASLVFTISDYRFIEKLVHTRLTSSTLGPNRELPEKILNYFLLPKNLHELRKLSKRRIIKILDPFAGSGAFSFLLAKVLTTNNITKFHILNGDTSEVAYKNGKSQVKFFAPNLYERYSSKIGFIKQNGLTLSKTKESSLDFIVCLRSLHEHNSKNIISFFEHSVRALRWGGKLLAVDVTREKRILKRARKLLPLLSKFSAFVVSMENYKRNPRVAENFMDKVLCGDPYLAQAGIQSYAAGFTKEELVKLAQESGISKNAIKAYYNFDPPIGSVQLQITK